MKKIFLPILLIVFFSSCRKVIKLDLKNNEPRYVIEGIITNQNGVCSVLISRSKNFYGDNQFAGISGAQVKVKDNGVEFILNETSSGIYENSTLNGTPGHVYELSVSIGNEIFSAISKMPQPVNLDTLFISTGPFGQFKFPNINYTDPAGINNGYRFVQYVNGIKDPAIFWDDDEFTDGQFISRQLDSGIDREDDPGNIKSGDAVRIDLLTIDEAVLKFWYTLSTGGAEGGGHLVAPSNPVTNIQGGALGYFSAHTVSSRTVIAP